MLSDFSPESDLERAFVQAIGWHMDKIWQEADRNGDRQDWPRFLGQCSSLAHQLAVFGRREHLNTVTRSMIHSLEKLSDSDRESLFKVCTYVVADLLEQNISSESVEVRLLLHVLCVTLRKADQKSLMYLNMLRKMKSLLNRQLDAAQLEKLLEDCEKAAAETHFMQLEMLSEHTKQRIPERLKRIYFENEQDKLKFELDAKDEIIENLANKLEKTRRSLASWEGTSANVLESMPAGIIVLSADGTIFYVNSCLAGLVRYRREDILNVDVSRILKSSLRGPELFEQLRLWWGRLIESKLLTQHGQEIDVFFSVSASGNNVNTITLCVVDATFRETVL